MPIAGGSRSALVGLAFAVAGLVLGCLWPSIAQADFKWDYTPYRVQVWVALGDDSATPPALFDPIARRLAERAEYEFGATWDLKVEQATPAIAARMNAGGIELPTESLGTPPPDADKLILLSVIATGEGLELSARELDLRALLWSNAESRLVRQRALVADEAYQLVREVFSPVARVDRTTTNVALAHPKAGRLIVDPASPARILPGQLLQPVVRRNDGRGRALPADIQPIPWTLLLAAKMDDEGVLCDVHTGIRGPLGAKTSIRTERLAVVVRPALAETRLALVSRLDQKQPLVGYEVLLQAPPEYTVAEAAATSSPASANAAKTPAPRSLGRTDWRGEIAIPVGASPLSLVLIKSGREGIAKLPLAPGLQERVRALVTDDGPRLDAEGYLTGVQESIIDQIARRQVLAARIRKRLEERKVAEAEKLMATLVKLPTRDQLKTQIGVQQQRYRSADDRVQAKITKLFTDTRNLVDTYLDPKLLQDLSAEIARAKPGGTAARQ